MVVALLWQMCKKQDAFVKSHVCGASSQDQKPGQAPPRQRLQGTVDEPYTTTAAIVSQLPTMTTSSPCRDNATYFNCCRSQVQVAAATTCIKHKPSEMYQA
jgi:hypothetical protein